MKYQYKTIPFTQIILYYEITISQAAILSVEASVYDSSLSLFDCLIRPAQILSINGGVLIVDQICLVIPDPCRFPDERHGKQPEHAHRLVQKFSRPFPPLLTACLLTNLHSFFCLIPSSPFPTRRSSDLDGDDPG